LKRFGNLRGADAVVPAGLALLAYVLAIAQSPGLDSSDTKINLHIDPGQFLGQVASVWSPTQGLGHVQGGQYSGYLWPMGPFFALGHLVGFSDWLTERLWLGTLLAIAAWGTVRLLAALDPRPRAIGQVLAGVLYIANPWVIVIASRTTVTLLGYAALPWLMLVTYRGLREPRSWWPAAAFALITTSTAGGVNAAVTAFVLVGPVLLVIYEAISSPDVRWRDAAGFCWRALIATVAASVWWVVPILVQAGYGLAFLPYTEHLVSIGSTTSLSESLRLMGYWPTYLGVGYGPRLTAWFASGAAMLFNRTVLVASLLVPGYALAGFFWTRRWRYGPLFLLIGLVGLLLMSAGWPPGTPARIAAVFVYYHVPAVQFLRTTYKAGPLLALAVAVLAGVAAQMGWSRLKPPGRLVYGALATAAVVLAALPLFEGRALQLTWRSIPSAWTRAAGYLNRSLPSNARAVVLPGQDFAYYTWGASIDPILPALSTRPVAVRNVPPYDDIHAVDFLWTVDDLVQQQRLLPGQLGPLLDLMSARAVVSATDDSSTLSGALAPAAAARELSEQAGLRIPTRGYGPSRTFPPPAGTADGVLRLPEVRIYAVPARGLVRIEPRGPAAVVDGSAEGVADIAALHELRSSAPLLYAGDETAATIRRQAAGGADIFITDSNRRRVFVASQVLWSTGWTVPAGESLPEGSAVLDPFPSRGAAAQTVAVFSGVRDVLASYNNYDAQFPEHQPYAAFDGEANTWWGERSNDYLEVELNRPRAIPDLAVRPYQATPFARLQTVIVDGQVRTVHSGWNLLHLNLPPARTLKIVLGRVAVVPGHSASGVGLAEVRIPGVSIRESLRPPVLAERALRDVDLSHASLNYVFERTTDPGPLERGPAAPYQDPEQGLTRTFDPPAARTWTMSGLANVSPTASDPALDVLAGTRTAGAIYTSSGRLDGLPAYRASAAFDGSPGTAWVGPLEPNQTPWIAWTTPQLHTLRRLVLTRSSLPVRFPSEVRITAGRARTPPLAVSSSGVVTLPSRLRSRSFRLTVLRSTGSNKPAVAIARLAGAGTPTVAGPPARAPIAGRCGDLQARIGARTVSMRASGTVSGLNAGEPLAIRSCRAPVPLPAADLRFTIAPSTLLPLIMQLRSPAPDPVPTGTGGSVLASGHEGEASFSGIRVHVNAPSWLVLGESYSSGWQASCNGRSLGAPRVIDAFANGWPVDPGCRSVSIWFGPQSDVVAGFALGAMACLLLLVVLVAGLMRRTAPRRAIAAPEWTAGASGASFRFGRAVRRSPASVAGVSLAGGVAFALLLGVRAGILIGVAFAVILSCRLSSDAVIAAAGALLVIAIPVYYALVTGPNPRGYDAAYQLQHEAGHWMAAAAVALLTLALALEVTARRAPPSSR
jgi:arabinofuranan 3-O-arabinosyltransferase